MNSTQVLKVIKNLEKISRRPFFKKLDMSEADVHPCGTTHCHGGWYAIASLGFWKSWPAAGFTVGANLMARDLGFKDMDGLRFWAAANPHIWGNRDGIAMFGSSMSFYHVKRRPSGARTLQHIVDHWKEVRLRLIALEAREELKQMEAKAKEAQEGKIPEYKNISKMLSKIPVTQEVPDKVMQEA